MFGRLLVYLGQLWLEERPNGEAGRRYQVGAVAVNLTGRGRTAELRLTGTGLRTCLEVVERNLAHEAAAAELEGIAAGIVARCVLPWIALMQGGDDPAILERWKEVAGTEPDARRRLEYGGLALVFAEAAHREFLWKEGAKGWNMRESRVVAEWIAEGEVKLLLRLCSASFRRARLPT